MSRRLILAALAAAAVAPAFAPDRCPAPVEVEPNDDPSGEGYAGQVTLPSLPFLHEIQGTLSGAEDVDVFELHRTDSLTPAVVVLDGFSGSPSLQATHSVSAPGDEVSRSFPYALRVAARYNLFPSADERPNFVAAFGGSSEAGTDYTIRVAAPGAPLESYRAKAVFRDTPGGDSFSLRLRYDTFFPLEPGDTVVRVYLRDYMEELPASAFVANKSGTKFTYKSKSGIRKVSWNTKAGTIAVSAKGIDFEAAPTDSSIPAVVMGDHGATGTNIDGVRKAGRKSTKISFK